MDSERRRNITRRGLIAGGLGVAGVGGGWLEHDSLRVERVRVRPQDYQGPELKVAFLSDMHIASDHDFGRAMRAVEIVASLKPDVLLLGGDYISRGSEFREHDVHNFLAACAKVAPAAGVLGNHDYDWDWPGRLRWHFSNVGIPLLVNREVSLGGLRVYGCDDVLFGDPQPPEGEAPHIILLHEPDYVTFMPQRCLVLSGHSHGGQLCLPFGIPLFLPKGGKDVRVGLSWVNRRLIYVSRGIGTTGVPLRAFCPPEVTLLELLRP